MGTHRRVCSEGPSLQKWDCPRGRPGSQTSILPWPEDSGVLARLVLPRGGDGGPGRPGQHPVWCLQAYLKWLSEGGKDRQLPGLELTHEQLFFVNYAQVGVTAPRAPAPAGNPPPVHILGEPPLWGASRDATGGQVWQNQN